MSHLKEYKRLSELLNAMQFNDVNKMDSFFIIKLEEFTNTKDYLAPASRLGFFQVALSSGHNVSLSVGKNSYSTSLNNLTVISPNQLIDCESKPPIDQSFGYMLFFESNFLNGSESISNLYKSFPFFNINSVLTYSLSSEGINTLKSLAEKLYNEFTDIRKNDKKIIHHYLMLFLLESKRMITPILMSNQQLTRNEDITYQFENLVAQSLNKRLSLKEFAKQLNISTVYLSECIKKTTGKTAKQLMNEYTILEAKFLLEKTSKTIDEIAWNLGFEDSSYFIRFFKKQVALTPLVYREST